MLEPATSDREHFADYLPRESWFLLVEPSELEEEGRHYLERLERPQDLHGVSDGARGGLSFPVGHGGGRGRGFAGNRPAT